MQQNYKKFVSALKIRQIHTHCQVGSLMNSLIHEVDNFIPSLHLNFIKSFIYKFYFVTIYDVVTIFIVISISYFFNAAPQHDKGNFDPCLCWQYRYVGMSYSMQYYSCHFLLYLRYISCEGKICRTD